MDTDVLEYFIFQIFFIYLQFIWMPTGSADVLIRKIEVAVSLYETPDMIPF